MIARWGEKNPFGKPNWRVCLAQNVMVLRGGIFKEMPGGEGVMFAVGAAGKVHYRPMSPTRVKSGYFEVPRYPHQGWIMERWQPAHMWGTPDEWAANKSEDGTPMMGPYPKEGDYFMICGPFPKLPEWSDMECAIAQYERQQRMRPADMAMALKMAFKNEKEALEKRRQKFEDELELRRKSDLEPVMRSGSLAASRYRQYLNKISGQTGHSGLL